MTDAIERLLEATGPGLGAELADDEPALDMLRAHGDLGTELESLLRQRNGFYRYAKALLIRPLQRNADPKGIVEWNAKGGWRAEYTVDLSGALFFAEDVFGEQFALRENGVWRFNPESGNWTFCASTIETWALSLQEDEGRMEVGSPLAERWQRKYGEIPSGRRLRPPIPFVFEESVNVTLDDYRPIPEDEVMGFLATIANALEDVPSGGKVRLRTTRNPDDAVVSRRERRRWWWPFGPRS